MGYFGCAYGLFLPVYALSITGLSTAVASLVAKEYGAYRYHNVRKIRRTARLVFICIGLLLSVGIWLLGRTGSPATQLPIRWLFMLFR